MKHYMHLNPQPFAGIKSGVQQIESRLNDDKRQQIKVGDDIEFTDRAGGETFVAQVIELLPHPSFEELFNSQPPQAFGGETKQELLDAVYKYYSHADEQRYGVVGIKLQVLPATQLATFGAGCFWGVQTAFDAIPGVGKTTVGYTGGTLVNPTYEQVCHGDSGHAEAVQIEFDPAQVPYETLVRKFFELHNPTTLNRQGPDVGHQYRSAIFYQDNDQKLVAERVKSELDQSGEYKTPIVTEIIPAETFYPAEDYHQKYLEKRGLASCHV